MSFAKRWKDSKAAYSKATGEKKPGGVFEKLFGTGIEGALQKLESATSAGDLATKAQAVAKQALPYQKELTALAAKEKDNAKKKAIAALNAALGAICEDLYKLGKDLADIKGLTHSTVFKQKKYLDEFYQWTKKSNLEGGTYEIEFLKECLAKTLDSDPVKSITYYFVDNEINTDCTNEAKQLLTRLRDRTKAKDDPEFMTGWKKVQGKAQNGALQTLIDPFGRFQTFYAQQRLADLSK